MHEVQASLITEKLRNISKVSNIVRIILKFSLILRSFGQANPKRPHFLTASRYETYIWIHGVRTTDWQVGQWQRLQTYVLLDLSHLWNPN